MRHRLSALRMLVLAPLAVTLACADAASEPQSPPSAPLTLCVSAQWMAYRNEGGEWTRLVPGADPHVTIDATRRLVIARGSGMGQPNVTPHLHIDFLTAEQARVQFSCTIGPFPSALGTLSGDVIGVAPDGYAFLWYGGRRGIGGLVPGSSPTFQLWTYEDERDLVATRWPSYALQPEHADRVIMRRAQRLAVGTHVTLDFTSAEAFAPAPHTLSWHGPAVGAQLNFQTRPMSRDWSDVWLQTASSRAPLGADGPHALTLYGIPQAQLAAGDLHRMTTGDGRRSLEFYYHEGRDRTIAWGPMPSQPRLTVVGTSPNVRLRVEVASQPEYGAEVSAVLSQYAVTNGFHGATNRVFMSATREYFGGTPRTWTLEMPDLSRAPGFQNVFGLRPGAYEWTFGVTSRPYWFDQSDAVDGMVIRSARGSGEGTVP